MANNETGLFRGLAPGHATARRWHPRAGVDEIPALPAHAVRLICPGQSGGCGGWYCSPGQSGWSGGGFNGLLMARGPSDPAAQALSYSDHTRVKQIFGYMIENHKLISSYGVLNADNYRLPGSSCRGERFQVRSSGSGRPQSAPEEGASGGGKVAEEDGYVEPPHWQAGWAKYGRPYHLHGP